MGSCRVVVYASAPVYGVYGCSNVGCTSVCSFQVFTISFLFFLSYCFSKQRFCFSTNAFFLQHFSFLMVRDPWSILESITNYTSIVQHKYVYINKLLLKPSLSTTSLAWPLNSFNSCLIQPSSVYCVTHVCVCLNMSSSVCAFCVWNRDSMCAWVCVCLYVCVFVCKCVCVSLCICGCVVTCTNQTTKNCRFSWAHFSNGLMWILV